MIPKIEIFQIAKALAIPKAEKNEMLKIQINVFRNLKTTAAPKLEHTEVKHVPLLIRKKDTKGIQKTETTCN